MKVFVKNLGNAFIIYQCLNILLFFVAYFQQDNIEHIKYSQGVFFINHQQIGRTLHDSWKLIMVIFFALSYNEIKERLKPYW